LGSGDCGAGQLFPAANHRGAHPACAGAGDAVQSTANGARVCAGTGSAESGGSRAGGKIRATTARGGLSGGVRGGNGRRARDDSGRGGELARGPDPAGVARTQRDGAVAARERGGIGGAARALFGAGGAAGEWLSLRPPVDSLQFWRRGTQDPPSKNEDGAPASL